MMLSKNKIIKRFRKILKKQRDKYLQKLETERNKYICILTHDIKTPLLAQSQTLELLLSSHFGYLNNSQKEILSEILNSNKLLLETVINTLFLTRYEKSDLKLNLENVNILKELEDCCLNLSHFAKNKQQKIILKTQCAKNLTFKADKKYIQKIIFNLLSSSIFYGFEKSNIEILVKESKESVSIVTKNQSVYMTKEKIKSLFEDKKGLSDFNQLGMNLNLNIAKKLINAHDWDIIAKSRKNNSSVFGFVIKKPNKVLLEKS